MVPSPFHSRLRTHFGKRSRMSESGQTETSGLIRARSGLPPTTDMRSLYRHDRFVPISEVARTSRLSLVASSLLKREQRRNLDSDDPIVP
jgi:hypothetical protein